MSLLAKQKQTHRLQEGAYCCQREGWEEGIVRGLTLLYLKWITNKDLHRVHTYIQYILTSRPTFSTWNSAQCYVAAWMRRGFIGEWVHAYVKAESLCCSPETVTTCLLIGYTPV